MARWRQNITIDLTDTNNVVKIKHGDRVIEDIAQITVQNTMAKSLVSGRINNVLPEWSGL